MYTIMIIEDDYKLAEKIAEHLHKHGYDTAEVDDFHQVEKQVEGVRPDLILLDINLPYYDGFYLCRSIRNKSRIPIIIISARNAEVEQVMGMELGADDYLTKPFSMEVLLAKIKANLRRVYGMENKSDNTTLTLDELVLNEEDFSLKYRGKSVELSKNEFKLLKELMLNTGKIVTREKLLEKLWDDSSFVDDNTLTVNVSRVKNKLSQLGIQDLIKTKRGVGYILTNQAGDRDEWRDE